MSLPVTWGDFYAEYAVDFTQYYGMLNEAWEKRLRNDVRDVCIPSMGLAGEAGEVLEHFKKHIRDGEPIVGNGDLLLELGDVLHYWCRCVKLAGFTPEEVMTANQKKLIERKANDLCRRFIAADETCRLPRGHAGRCF